jgi:hypothetical protein
MAVSRIAWLAPLVVFGCQSTPSLLQAQLQVSDSDVYVLTSTPTPLASASGTRMDELLLATDGSPLGRDPANPNGCKQVPVFWVPTQPAEQTPTTDRVTPLCTTMPQVDVASWHGAHAQVTVRQSGDGYRVEVGASGLVPDSVYSAWLLYSNGSAPFAVAPLGGLPNLLLPDDGGKATLSRQVPSRLLRSGSLLVGAVASGAAVPMRIDGSTRVTLALYYHSRAQSNGNTSTARQLPPGHLAVIGEIGRDAHLHLSASFAALP